MKAAPWVAEALRSHIQEHGLSGVDRLAPHFERMGRMLGLYSANGYDDVEGASGGTLGDTPTQEGETAGVEKA